MITGLDAAIVGHRRWALRRWFRSGAGRYYHRAGHPGVSSRVDQAFYALIDPALRPICRQLHAQGIGTTPSCEGHFHGHDYFRERWEELLLERDSILGDGLPVVDSESGESFLFRQPDHRIPWRTFNHFYRESMRHQATGYLGILVPSRRVLLQARLHTLRPRAGHLRVLADARRGRLLGGALFHVLVTPGDPDDLTAQWHRVAEWVGHALAGRHSAG